MGYSSVKMQAQGIAVDEFDENSPEAQQQEVDRLTRVVSSAYADPDKTGKNYLLGRDFQIGKLLYQKGTVYSGEKWGELASERSAPAMWEILSETNAEVTA